jgi:hypothetical protein
MSTTVQTFKRRGTTIWLNSVEYTGFYVGNLPKRFAFIYDAENDQEGLSSWFNRGGLTYIRKSDLNTSPW